MPSPIPHQPVVECGAKIPLIFLYRSYTMAMSILYKYTVREMQEVRSYKYSSALFGSSRIFTLITQLETLANIAEGTAGICIF